MSLFKKATKEQSKLRMAIIGPAGSGKTYTALAVATGLGKKVAVIDTERGSASKYSSIFGFDVLNLESFSPTNYIMAIDDASKAGYDVVVIDSLSHAWVGRDGALEQVDKAKARSQSGNSFTAWRDVTPLHNKMVDAIIGAKMHVIATMRTKTEYIMEKDERTGKTVPKKIGTQPVQRDNLDYEFDVVGDMNQSNQFLVTKTRCPELNNVVLDKPGAELAKVLLAWLTDGVAPVEKPVAAPVEEKKSEPAAAEQGTGKEPEADTFSVKGVVAECLEKEGRYGIKITGKKQTFGTFSAPAYEKAKSLVGKRVELVYSVSTSGDRQIYNVVSITEIIKEAK